MQKQGRGRDRVRYLMHHQIKLCAIVVMFDIYHYELHTCTTAREGLGRLELPFINIYILSESRVL